jgi:hypothetical protein
MTTKLRQTANKNNNKSKEVDNNKTSEKKSVTNLMCSGVSEAHAHFPQSKGE